MSQSKIIYPLARPEISVEDRQAVNNVLKSQTLSRGPQVKAFEQAIGQLTAMKYACAVSSGTAGLIMALQVLGVQAGDEVITVSFTVPATVNSIVALGAVPVMVDIEMQTLGMCPEALKQAINKKTKAIIVVHAFGKAAKMAEIMEIAHSKGIKVIEDACEALGNRYANKALGSLADIGVFAFYPNKQITTGEGGMLVTNHAKWQEQFKLLRNHGRSMNGDLYDQICFGWNFRMSELNAALGLSQLKRLDEIICKRQKIAYFYQQGLQGNALILCPQFSVQENNSAWFVYVVQVPEDRRDSVLQQLTEAKIQCGRYFAPVHMQPYYRARYPKLKLKNTENTAAKCLALPFYTQLKQHESQIICQNLLKVL